MTKVKVAPEPMAACTCRSHPLLAWTSMMTFHLPSPEHTIALCFSSPDLLTRYNVQLHSTDDAKEYELDHCPPNIIVNCRDLYKSPPSVRPEHFWGCHWTSCLGLYRPGCSRTTSGLDRIFIPHNMNRMTSCDKQSADCKRPYCSRDSIKSPSPSPSHSAFSNSYRLIQLHSLHPSTHHISKP